ncbi:MAG: hypothetical protein BVN33_07545 [Proteobacteria bacterium ST_bin13]|nr:MAG: hypothetical protein BVN33_07545 [Proteobacteria bacterium ST_bin13]
MIRRHRRRGGIGGGDAQKFVATPRLVTRRCDFFSAPRTIVATEAKKALIHELLGDGIMIAISFSTTVGGKTIRKAERASSSHGTARSFPHVRSDDACRRRRAHV